MGIVMGVDNGAKYRGNQHIQTSFGLEVFFESEQSDDIFVERIAPVIQWGSLESNNTLDVYFNISSPSNITMDLSFKYHFDYSFGRRAAAFLPETFTFSEIINGKLKPLDGAGVDLGEETLTQELAEINVSHNRTFTISGVLDVEPPSMVTIESIEVRREGEVTIDYKQVPDAFGYYLYLTDKKFVNIETVKPYNKEPFNTPPIIITHLNVSDVVYISITGMDFAGNINPQVECERFEMRIPNRPPIAKIDPLEDSYYEGDVVYFISRSTYDPDPDDELIYSWDLNGDGIEDSTQKSPTYTYEQARTYQVTLTVIDRETLSDSDAINIVILKKEETNEDVAKETYDIIRVVLGTMIGITILVVIVYWVIIHKRIVPVTGKHQRQDKKKRSILKKKRISGKREDGIDKKTLKVGNLKRKTEIEVKDWIETDKEETERWIEIDEKPIISSTFVSKPLSFKSKLTSPQLKNVSLSIKKIIPNHPITHKIDSGGAAAVYKALDERGEIVAIKLPKLLDDTVSTSILEEFKAEADIWKKLKHNNIVKFHKGDIRPIPYLVIELMDGGNLKHLMKKHRFSIEETINIMLQVLDGLSYAHRMASVHRDIKPENILFTKDGIPKISDWGIGKFMGSMSTEKTMGMKGTMLYSAPEQISKAKFGQVDWTTDIFQLGIVFYEMITREHPFYDEDPVGIIGKIIGEDPVPPSEINPMIPNELDNIIMTALQKDKAKRWRSADIMHHELKRLVEG